MKIEVTQCSMCTHYNTEQYCEVWEQYITNDAFYCACGVTADRKTESNLILPERMERGERFEVGETIVVMNRDDYYDLLCKSWKDESHTDTHDEAIKAMATLIKAKTEPQTDIGTSDTVYSDTAGYVPRVDMTDCSWK